MSSLFAAVKGADRMSEHWSSTILYLLAVLVVMAWNHLKSAPVANMMQTSMPENEEHELWNPSPRHISSISRDK